MTAIEIAELGARVAQQASEIAQLRRESADLVSEVHHLQVVAQERADETSELATQVRGLHQQLDQLGKATSTCIGMLELDVRKLCVESTSQAFAANCACEHREGLEKDVATLRAELVYERNRRLERELSEHRAIGRANGRLLADEEAARTAEQRAVDEARRATHAIGTRLDDPSWCDDEPKGGAS